VLIGIKLALTEIEAFNGDSTPASGYITNMNHWLKHNIWSAIVVPMIAAPVLVMFLPPRPGGSGFWWDLAIAFGFAGLAMFGMQFLLTARFQKISAPFGIDIIYIFHRYLAILGLIMITAHYGVFRIKYPASLGQLLPGEAPWYMSAGRLGFILFLIIVFTSLLRKKLNLEYDHWRLLHSILAISAIFLSVGHILGIGNHSGLAWKTGFWDVYLATLTLLILYIRLYKPWRLINKPYEITEVKKENNRVTTLTVQPAANNSFNFLPGQFAWISIGSSPFALKEHPFSIASSPATDGSMQFTIKSFGDFTEQIKYLQAGSPAFIDGPYGSFSIDRFPRARAFVFIAGGIGIAPIMSMLRAMADRNDKRPCILIYANNRKDDIVFYDALEQLKSKLDMQLFHVLRHAPESWTGEAGCIDKIMLSRLLSGRLQQSEYFICGPKAMAQSVQLYLYQLGVPMKNTHNELFDLV
jgi:predicted ferric reductase